jgi:hypothetical protein
VADDASREIDKNKMISSRAVFIKLWDSPTITTWASYGTRALSLFVVLPLILKNFQEGEVALWYLFSTFIALQGVLDMGFRNTYIRIISFAIGGAQDIDTGAKLNGAIATGLPNWRLVFQIYANMRYTYSWLCVAVLILMTVVGSFFMVKPISYVEDTRNAWLSWSLIIIVSIIRFYGTVYSNYLEGLNKIALVRRWESITSAASTLCSIMVLLVSADLIWLVLINQIWVVVGVIRNRWLSRKAEGGRLKLIESSLPFDAGLFWKIWPLAWRSGLSGLMSNGLTHITTVMYAQIGNSAGLASYLIALRILTQIKEISMAPFYSKIPLYARLRIKGAKKELIKQAQWGMFLSHIVFVSGVICVGTLSATIIKYLGSEIQFISGDLWLLLSLAYFVHRYGAMHMQLYLTTNHVIAHIADGVSGAIYVVVTLATIGTLQLYAVPIGLLAGYLGFYAWYAMYYSYKSLNMSIFDFELKASLVPISLFAVYSLVQLI